MKKVLIATEKPFSKAAVEKIKSILESGDITVKLLEKYTDVNQLYEAVADVNGLIVRSDEITKDVIDHAPNLEIIVRAGAGYDNIDLQAAKERGIVVENTPGQNSNAVAELVAGMMIMNARNFYDGSTGTELKGKKLGIQGFGAVGKCLARIANGLGMYVHFYDIFVPFEAGYEYNVFPVEDIKYLYKTCQYVSLHIPALPSTIISINYDLMSLMPQGAVLINSARAEIIDEDDLLKMFETRPDFHYLADVAPSNKAVIEEKFPGRFFFTPKKCGAQTSEANNNAGTAAANQIVSFFLTGDKKYQVNK
ncbi:MAG TPA: NAD(P)-dependent oxidoreductase [Flexilinea sp.]|nr:NAD(P)-dependent oxidoreductase [Flexilinea sp.]